MLRIPRARPGREGHTAIHSILKFAFFDMISRDSGSFRQSSIYLGGPDLDMPVAPPRSRSAGRMERPRAQAMTGRPPPIDHSAARPRAVLQRVVSAPELLATSVEASWLWADDSIRSSPAWSSASFSDLSDIDACSISSRSRASTSCEGSEDEQDEQCRLAPEPDWAARFTRAQAENTRLLSIADDLLTSRLRAPLSQRDLVEVLAPPDAPEAAGICLGLSMEWLAACHARPEQSAHEGTRLVGEVEQARHAQMMQRAYVAEYASEPAALRRPVNRAFSKTGIEIDKHRLFTCHPSFEPVSDVAARVARHMSRQGPYHLLNFCTDDDSHAIACVEQASGMFCVFDPNMGSFDVERGLLAELLASLFVSFASVEAPVESPSAGKTRSDDAEAPAHNLGAIFVSPVRFAEPSHKSS